MELNSCNLAQTCILSFGHNKMKQNKFKNPHIW